LLVALPDSGQIVAIDKRLVDPRRPPMPTQGQNTDTVMFYQQEGIPPNDPILHVNPYRVVNYNLTVLGIWGITVSSTDVESRTDVLCHGGWPSHIEKWHNTLQTSGGLDVYYLQRSLSASKSYDILSDSFNEWAVILCIAVLVALSFVTSALATQSALRTAWK